MHIDQQLEVITQSSGCPIEDVVTTAELAGRPVRLPDYASENAALLALSQCLAESPQEALKKLVMTALDLTHAHSAGISLAEGEGADAIFRWRATAGEFDRYLGGTMPRNFSPCGTVLERGTSLLMTEPVRAYPYISGLHRPVLEVLLVPFSRGDQLIGTVWVVAHTDAKRFDTEDLRIVSSLARFASLATKALEDRDVLEQTSRALALENRRKTEFLATLGHELRNPLAPIRNALEVVKRDATKAPLVVPIMERQVSQLVRLIDDLLDVSRITSGKLVLRRERVAVSAIVANALEATQAQLAVNSHALSVTAPDDIYIDADSVRMTQVVTNLLTNASKYTPHGGRIDVNAHATERSVSIAVSDTGIGIKPEQMEHIFDLFGQEHAEMSQGGLGIGLALARRLVTLHGGELTARSAGPALGSTFEVVMPRI